MTSSLSKPLSRMLLLIIGVAAVLAAYWALDSWVLRPQVLTPLKLNHQLVPALTPLYAFWFPVFKWQGLLYVLAAGLLVWSALRLTDPQKTPESNFLVYLGLISLVLPVLLFGIRQNYGSLGKLLLLYPGEEVYFDAFRIYDLSFYISHYVDYMPRLSLHGKHFPPGYSLLIYGLTQAFGEGVLIVAMATLVFFAAGCLFFYLAYRRMAGMAAARQGALLMLTIPSLLDFACTSMDAIFFGWAGLCLWMASLTVGAMKSDRWNQSVLFGALLGLTLALAAYFSFVVFPLGLALGLYIGLTGWKKPGRTALTLGMTGVLFFGVYLVFYALTGFSMYACLLEAAKNNHGFMNGLTSGRLRELYWNISFGNLFAFGIGSGVAVVAALIWRLSGDWKKWDAWEWSVILTLATMTFGHLFQMETERIWIFAMPWLVAVIIGRGPLIEAPLFRLLLLLGLSQAFVMEILFLTLW
ncbi:MAG: hypothetical protein SFY92_04650 [Verrucomicrobiae bacterium]|nr:hypothetical protein [Verrucomicrobiae bacterium]